MKEFLIICSFIMLVSLKTPLESVREQFLNINNLEQAEGFIEQLKQGTTAEAKGYYAAMVFMKSRFVKNPFSKLKHFKQGKKILDQDIVENPLNVEIRYIRYIMQKQIPNFLGYNDFISEDFNVITQEMVNAKLDLALKKYILNNMLLLESLKIEEKEKIEQTLDKL
ncbi:hypothetical protein [Lutibacter citreus]|uniref:hypothetical protein n=1 Tax=Lutibacter citreus TaxID=2138210 RepID=UPI000DBE0E4C|nr:hypothetical protein [Lutibacter citreus]